MRRCQTEKNGEYSFDSKGPLFVTEHRPMTDRLCSSEWKEKKVAECLMSWGRLFQMQGPKCVKVRKPCFFYVEALKFEHACVWQKVVRAGRTVKVQ